MGIEHFGRQFSEIGCLHDLGLDYLKIDASFIRGLEAKCRQPVLSSGTDYDRPRHRHEGDCRGRGQRGGTRSTGRRRFRWCDRARSPGIEGETSPAGSAALPAIREGPAAQQSGSAKIDIALNMRDRPRFYKTFSREAVPRFRFRSFARPPRLAGHHLLPAPVLPDRRSDRPQARNFHSSPDESNQRLQVPARTGRAPDMPPAARLHPRLAQDREDGAKEACLPLPCAFAR